MRSKDERRAEARMELEQAARDYYSACLAAGYDFNNDVCDVIHDATDGAVNLNEA